MDDLKPVIRWRAWCAGGRVYDSSDTAADDLPDAIIGVVGLEGGEYKARHLNVDWYFWDGDLCGCLAECMWRQPLNSLLSHDVPGRWVSPDPILARFPDATLKRGIWVPDAEYAVTRQAILRWP